MAMELISYSCCIKKKKIKIAILGRTEGQKCPCWLDVKVGLEIESSAPLKVKPGGM